MTGEGQTNADGGEQDALDEELKMSQQMYRPNNKGQKLSKGFLMKNMTFTGEL